MKKFLFFTLLSFFCLNAFSQTCKLTISVSGPGNVKYFITYVKNGSTTFDVDYGRTCKIWINPSDNCRLKSLKRNGQEISPTSSNLHEETILGNTNLDFVFEQIPTSFSLSIKSSGDGSATYNGESIRKSTQKYTVYEGDAISIKFNPDDGNRIKSVKENAVLV